MPVKDYYAMLELAPNATPEEIKRSFRRLALRFHPDTNQGNRHAEAWFRELQEAYETLTDAGKRETYLRERWLAKSQGRALVTVEPRTPDWVLRQVRQLRSDVAAMDHFRMDHRALAERIAEQLQPEYLAILAEDEEDSTRTAVLDQLLLATDPLEFEQVERLSPVFFRAAELLPLWHDTWLVYYKRRRRTAYWEKNQTALILLISTVLCVGIFLLTR